jgi:hypothetical protein
MACSLHRVRAAGFLEVDYVVPRRRTRKRSIGRDSYSYFMGVSQRLIFCGKGGVAVCDGGMLRLFEGGAEARVSRRVGANFSEWLKGVI